MPDLRFFTAVEVQVEVFCAVTQCGVVVAYQRFGGSCCLRLHGFATELLITVSLTEEMCILNCSIINSK
jgi:hypothetical protein